VPAGTECEEDQMNMHYKNTVSSMSNVVVIIHRWTYDLRMKRLRFQAFKFELIPNGE
jgi:hypothetical protein